MGRHIVQSVVTLCRECSIKDGVVWFTLEDRPEADRRKSYIDIGLFYASSHEGHSGMRCIVVEHEEGLSDTAILEKAMEKREALSYYVYDFEKDAELARFATSNEAHDYINNADADTEAWFVVMDWPFDEDEDEAIAEAYDRAKENNFE